MSDISPESELFRALFADVLSALKPHISDMACRVRDQRAWVAGPMTGGRFLYVEIVIDDNMPEASAPSGEWWNWTPTP